MKRFSVIGLMLFVTFSYTGKNYWLSHWYNKWGFMMIILSLGVGLFVGKKFSYYLTAPITWTLWQGIYVFSIAPNKYTTLPANTFTDIRAISAMALSLFCIVLLFFTNLPRNYSRHIREGLGWVVLLATMEILVSALVGMPARERVVLLGNPSMVGCLMASLFPFMIEVRLPFQKPLVAILLKTTPLVALLLLESTLPVVVFSIVIGIYAIKQIEETQSHLFHKRDIFLGVGLSTIVATSGFIYLKFCGDNEILNSSGRFEYIWHSFQVWIKQINPLTGVGLNLTTYYLPNLQHQWNHWQEDLWFWFHSDVYQTLFEQGLIGLIAWGALAYKVIKESSNDKVLIASAVGYGVTALFNYPVHTPLGAFALAYLVWESLGLAQIKKERAEIKSLLSN